MPHKSPTFFLALLLIFSFLPGCTPSPTAAPAVVSSPTAAVQAATATMTVTPLPPTQTLQPTPSATTTELPTETPLPPVPTPTRSQILEVLTSNGFSQGSNDQHYRNSALSLDTYLGDGKYFVITIDFTTGKNADDQITKVINVLESLYSAEMVTWVNSAIPVIAENAIKGGQALTTSKSIQGYGINVYNPIHAGGKLEVSFVFMQ